MAKTILLLGCLALLYGTSLGARIVFKNRGKSTIWVGTLGNTGHAVIKNGGFVMRPGASVTANVSDNWSGRVWGRTGCVFDLNGKGSCKTGDCGRRLKCGGNVAVLPVTQVVFTLGGYAGQDIYDVSLIDGFNMPMTIAPIDKNGGGNSSRCRPAVCSTDINHSCPAQLRKKIGGKTVACMSACDKFKTDQYCCRGPHNRLETCWGSDYPAFFKNKCPDAYSYAYDDQRSIFTCERTGYKITFG